MSVSLYVDAPCLIVDAGHVQIRSCAIETRGTCLTGFNLLHVFREVENCISSRRPLWHLKIQRLQVRVDRQSDLNSDFKQMRDWMRHRQPILDVKRLLLRETNDCDREQQ